MAFRTRALLLVVPLVGFATAVQAQITTTRVASGLLYPVYATAPAGDAQRLFIVEQRGVIRILKNGGLLATPFLDIDALVVGPTSSGDERGLLGLAFAPDYGTSGHFYVYYTDNAGDSRLRRYTVSANPDVADPLSGFDILFADQPFTNHNGGTVEFGPDGYLYLGLGDGGNANDPLNNGQNGLTLLGKMLRLDPSSDAFPGDPLQNYAIPPTNPFVGNPAFLDEIWAYGLRNPYRWSFDRVTGDQWIGDVGQGCWEEIDFEPAGSPGGRNYGWKRLEGNHCFVAGGGCFPTGCDSTGITLPVREYSHTQDGFSCSVTGGAVYRGTAIPSLVGTYFYADYCSGQIYSFRWDGANVNELTNRTAELAPGGGLAITRVVAFGQDGVDELYLVDRASTTGEVYKVIPDPDFTGVDPVPGSIVRLELGAPRPNPFAAFTRFELAMPSGGDLRVSVHDAAGRLVRELWRGPAEAGRRTMTWDGRDEADVAVSAGIYFVRAESGGVKDAQRIVHLR